MLTFAVLAILLIIFVLLFKRKPRSGYAEVIQKYVTVISVLIENACNFISRIQRRKRRRTRIKIGAVFWGAKET